MKCMTITSVRLNYDIERHLDFLAKKLDRSKSYIINQAVREFVVLPVTHAEKDL